MFIISYILEHTRRPPCLPHRIERKGEKEKKKGRRKKDHQTRTDRKKERKTARTDENGPVLSYDDALLDFLTLIALRKSRNAVTYRSSDSNFLTVVLPGCWTQ